MLLFASSLLAVYYKSKVHTYTQKYYDLTTLLLTKLIHNTRLELKSKAKQRADDTNSEMIDQLSDMHATKNI